MEREQRLKEKEEKRVRALLEKEKEDIEKEKKAMEARWRRYSKEVTQAEDSPETTPKKKRMPAAVAQSPLPSKQKAATLLSLTRAPISQPATKPLPTIQQRSGMAQAFQESPPPPAPQLVGPAPVTREPPPAVAPQVRPAPMFPQSALTAKFQTFQEVDSGLAKKQEGWQAEE